jgi:phosphoglycerate-specific signal transduction histidine kinase
VSLKSGNSNAESDKETQILGMLKTTITDSGNGIALKLLPGLFETFSIMKSGLN